MNYKNTSMLHGAEWRPLNRHDVFFTKRIKFLKNIIFKSF